MKIRKLQLKLLNLRYAGHTFYLENHPYQQPVRVLAVIENPYQRGIPGNPASQFVAYVAPADNSFTDYVAI